MLRKWIKTLNYIKEVWTPYQYFSGKNVDRFYEYIIYYNQLMEFYYEWRFIKINLHDIITKAFYEKILLLINKEYQKMSLWQRQNMIYF